MMNWLGDNQEWVVLAAGIIMVTVLVGIVARVMTRSKSMPVTPEPPPPPPLPPPPEPRITPGGDPQIR